MLRAPPPSSPERAGLGAGHPGAVDADSGGPGDPVGDLFDLDPVGFVAARNDLVKALRKAGDRDLAATVAELHRPSPAAWAVNQLSRSRNAELEALVRLGDALRDAQAEALEGADAQVLRQAGRARRDAVAALADAAVALLAERGPGAGAHAGEIVTTLEAASLDPRSGQAVLAGRLSSGLRPPSGLGDDGPAPTAPSHRRHPPPVLPDDPGPDAAVAERRERLERARRAVAEAEELADRRSADAATADDRLARQEAEVRAADDRAADLERALHAARAAAVAAARALTDARTAVVEAGAAAVDACERVTDARARVEALERER